MEKIDLVNIAPLVCLITSTFPLFGVHLLSRSRNRLTLIVAGKVALYMALVVHTILTMVVFEGIFEVISRSPLAQTFMHGVIFGLGTILMCGFLTPVFFGLWYKEINPEGWANYKEVIKRKS